MCFRGLEIQVLQNEKRPITDSQGQGEAIEALSKTSQQTSKHPLQHNMIWFFSDKKNFCQDQAVNNQNNCWLALCSEDVPKVMQTTFPAIVMVFGVVSSEGHIMLLYIFQKGLKVNTVEYLNILKMHVLPWIRKMANGGHMCGNRTRHPAIHREKHYFG